MSDHDLAIEIDRDRDRSRATGRWLAAGFGVTSLVLAGAGAVTARIGGAAAAVPELTGAAFCLLAAFLVPVVGQTLQRLRSRRWRQHERECAELTDVAAKIRDKGLAGLVVFNFRLLDRFVCTALGQARASFVACVVAATVGLFVLVAGMTAVLLVDSVGTQVTAGALTAAGVALSGYLSATFLRTFAMTSRQMSYYYGQPLVHCYLLHAEWLADRFERDAGPESRAKIQQDLIGAALEASRSAQNHLLDLNLNAMEHEVRRRRSGTRG